MKPPPPWYRDLQEVLSLEEKHSYTAISSVARQREFLLSRLLTRLCLSTYTKEKMGDLKLIWSKDGKPQLLNPIIRFNLSHTDRLIALALGRMELGVDVERVETRKSSETRYLPLARRFFTQEENIFISNLPDIEKKRGFFHLFTLKEALGKAMGTGLKGAFLPEAYPCPSRRASLGENTGVLPRILPRKAIRSLWPRKREKKNFPWLESFIGKKKIFGPDSILGTGKRL